MADAHVTPLSWSHLASKPIAGVKVKHWVVIGVVAVAAVGIAIMLTVLLSSPRRPAGFPVKPSAVCSLPLTAGTASVPFVITPLSSLSTGGVHDAVLAFDGQMVWCYDVTTQTMLISGVPLAAAPTWLVGSVGATLFGAAPWTNGVSGVTYVPAGGLIFAARTADVIAQVIPGTSDTGVALVLPAQMLFNGARGLARVPGAAAVAATAGGTSFEPTAAVLQTGEVVTIRSVLFGLYWQVPSNTVVSTDGSPDDIVYTSPSAGVLDKTLQFTVSNISFNPVVNDASNTPLNSISKYGGSVSLQFTSVAVPTISPGRSSLGSSGHQHVLCLPSVGAPAGTTMFVTPGPNSTWTSTDVLIPSMPVGTASSGVFLYPSNLAWLSSNVLYAAVSDTNFGGVSFPHILGGYYGRCRYLIEAVPTSSTPRVRGLLLNGAAPSADAPTVIEAHWSDGSVDAYDIPATTLAAGAWGWFQNDVPPLRVVPEADATTLPLVGALYQWSLWSAAPRAESILRVTVDSAGLVDVAGDASMPFCVQTLNVIWT